MKFVFALLIALAITYAQKGEWPPGSDTTLPPISIDHVENHKIQQNQNESDESKCGIKENSFSAVPFKRICK